jgi:BON domain
MHRKSPLVSSLALAVILAASVGCARKPDDAKISSDIQDKFSQDSGLSTKQLAVQASNGVVTLGGNVDNDAQRDAAARDAAAVPGVKEVVNNLVVGNTPAPAPAPEPAAVQAPPPAEKPAAAEHAAPPVPHKKSHKSHVATAASSSSISNANANQMAANTPPPPASPPDNTAAAATQPAPPPPPPAPKKFIIDQGTQLAVRLIDPIDSEKNQVGDTFHATLNAPLDSDGEVAVPAGVEITGHVVDVKSAGKFAGQSVVVLQLDTLSSGGQTYNLQTDQYRKQGSSRGKNTAEKVGGGAVLGGIIGALAGGGKGAAIGAAAGAGVGGGVQAASKSQQIKLPSETVLNFTLQAPVEVVQAPSPNADRQKLTNSQ